MISKRRATGIAAAAMMAASTGLAAVPADAAQVTMKLSPTTATVARGGDVALTVKVDTAGEQVNVNQMYITLPAGLHCKSIVPATTAWPHVAFNTCNDTTATLVDFSDGGTSFSGVGTMAVIHLTGVTKGRWTVALDPAQSLVAVVPGINPHATVNSATITVR